VYFLKQRKEQNTGSWSPPALLYHSLYVVVLDFGSCLELSSMTCSESLALALKVQALALKFLLGLSLTLDGNIY